MRDWTVLVALALAGCPPDVSLPDTTGGAALGGGGAEAGGGAGALGGAGGAALEDCSALDEACSRGVLVEGECVRSALPEGTPCDDGLACTTRDHCDAGACVPGGPYQCLSPDACHVAQCNVETGLCELVQANDGAPCNDSSACTASDTCEGGVCVGEELACYDPDDGNPCVRGECDPSLGCVTVPENLGAACGPATFCSEQRCQLDPVNPSQAGCFNVPVNDGVPCDDGNGCTQYEYCQAGSCLGAMIDNGTPCDDGISCNEGDVCVDGLCQWGASTCPPSADTCVATFCFTNPLWDVCMGLPDWGSPCDDPAPCRGSGNCERGLCKQAPPADEGLACDDDDACTTQEVCSAGACEGVPVTSCSSGDGCCPAGCDGTGDADCGAALYMASTQGLPGFYRLDLGTELWTTLPDPPAPPRSRLVSRGGVLYVEGEDRAIHAFDPGAGSWATVLQTPATAVLPPFGPAGELMLPMPGGFFLYRDNYNAFRSVGASWMHLWTTTWLDAGVVDAATGDLYLRTNGGGSMLSVFRLEASTNNESLWAEGNLLEVGLSSRFASFWGQTFFTVTSPNTHEILAVTAGYGTATLTGLFTADENPSSDLDPATGLIYLGPSDSAGAFEVFDPLLMTLSPLPSPPPIPDGYLSSVVVVRAPSAP